MNTERKDRELDWEDDIQESGQEYTLLPNGDYPFDVIKFERGRFDGSAKLPPCKMAILTLRVDGGDLGDVTIKHNLFLHTKCEGLLCSFFTGIGLQKPGETIAMPWSKVVGAHGRASVEIHEWKKRDGTDGYSNRVLRFLAPPDEKAYNEQQKPVDQGVF